MEKTNVNFLSLLWNVKNIGSIIVILSIFYLFIHGTASHDNTNVAASTFEKNACKCVIFRLDDIRNGFLEKPQLALMDFFISNNESISLGIIMDQIQYETNLYQKINEGYKKGLFELGIHGWNHVDYTKLTENEQMLSLLEANRKMKTLFGNYSKIFIPPFNLIDNRTLITVKNLDFKILSSAIYYDEPDILSLHKLKIDLNNDELIHMPEMTDFSIYYNNTWVKVPIKFLLADIDYDINTYGYSVIMLHPHNFATQRNGALSDAVDYDQIQSLANIVKAIKAKNLSIATFSETAGIK